MRYSLVQFIYTRQHLILFVDKHKRRYCLDSAPYYYKYYSYSSITKFDHVQILTWQSSVLHYTTFIACDIRVVNSTNLFFFPIYTYSDSTVEY